MGDQWWNYLGWPNFPQLGEEAQEFKRLWDKDDWFSLGGLGDFGKNPAQPQPGGAQGPAGGGYDPFAEVGRAMAAEAARRAQERSGGGSGGEGGPQGYYTPDGVLVHPGSAEDRYYQMADSLWTKIYGVHAPFSVVQTFHDLGVENTSQLETVMQGMPSHIKNPDGSRISIGQYDQIKGSGNTFSNKYFGRPVPDSLIQDWVSKGISTPESVEMWFLNHPAKDIPKDVYGQIFDEAAGWTQKYHNDLPHPDNVHAIYQGMQQQ